MFKVTSYVQGLPSPKFSPHPPPRAGARPQSLLSPGVPRCLLPQGREGKGRVPQLGGRKKPPLASSSLVWFWGARGARAEGGWGVEGGVSSHPPEHPSPRAATQPEVPTLWTLCLRRDKGSLHASQAAWELRPPFVHGPGHPPSGTRLRPGDRGINAAAPARHGGDACHPSPVPSPRQAPLTSAPQAHSAGSAPLPLPHPISAGPSPSSHPHPPSGLSNLSVPGGSRKKEVIILPGPQAGLAWEIYQIGRASCRERVSSPV